MMYAACWQKVIIMERGFRIKKNLNKLEPYQKPKEEENKTTKKKKT